MRDEATPQRAGHRLAGNREADQQQQDEGVHITTGVTWLVEGRGSSVGRNQKATRFCDRSHAVTLVPTVVQLADPGLPQQSIQMQLHPNSFNPVTSGNRITRPIDKTMINDVVQSSWLGQIFEQALLAPWNDLSVLVDQFKKGRAVNDSFVVPGDIVCGLDLSSQFNGLRKVINTRLSVSVKRPETRQVDVGQKQHIIRFDVEQTVTRRMSRRVNGTDGDAAQVPGLAVDKGQGIGSGCVLKFVDASFRGFVAPMAMDTEHIK